MKQQQHDGHQMLGITKHALEQMAERGIPREWVERVLDAPAQTEPDPSGGGRTRAFGPIAEAGGRVLRVVYDVAPDGSLQVVTAFLDRRARKRLRS